MLVNQTSFVQQGRDSRRLRPLRILRCSCEQFVPGNVLLGRRQLVFLRKALLSRMTMQQGTGTVAIPRKLEGSVDVKHKLAPHANDDKSTNYPTCFSLVARVYVFMEVRVIAHNVLRTMKTGPASSAPGAASHCKQSTTPASIAAREFSMFWLDREESMKPKSKLRIPVDIAIMNSTAET